MLALLSILIGTFTFLAALAAHILIWRRCRPARQILLLMLIFFAVPGVAYLAFFFSGFIGQHFPALLIALAGVWHLALSAAYIMTYPPIQTGCPSLNIVSAVHRAGKDGLSDEELLNLFDPDELLSERFRDLTGDGFIELKDDDAWGLNLSGKIVGAVFRIYRRILKLPWGEG